MKQKIEFSEEFRKAAHRAANYIEQDGPMSNRELAELVLDAGRLVSLGGEHGKKADEEGSRLIKEHGFGTVMAALARIL